ncbi:MAG TPA: sugar transferase [Gemmatimonadaceae bacterium]|jgi:lipopolysaccharide/colanic/teichoic acid biosynthesis glycosyltransferase
MKRAFDIVGAAVALALLSPILLVAAILIRVSMGAPVLFRQRRAGRNGAPFVLVKFRTMSGESRAGREGLDDAMRMTPTGRMLRRLSVDELPQIYNVLRGDMSLVGPRPLLLEYLPLYSTEQARRHEVRPGITGWAQVNGRNALTWNERLAMDVWYVDHRSLFLDMRVIALTIRHVASVRRTGDSVLRTMPRFTGSDRE